jgi:hypothetical protein
MQNGMHKRFQCLWTDQELKPETLEMKSAKRRLILYDEVYRITTEYDIRYPSIYVLSFN